MIYLAKKEKNKKNYEKNKWDKHFQRKNYSRLRIDENSLVIASELLRSIYVEFPAWLSRGKSVSFVRLDKSRGRSKMIKPRSLE